MTTRERWLKWHLANPDVYELFKRFTFEAIGHGHKNLSAWLIINRIRWETAVVTTGNPYKVPNDYIAHYSRLFMREYPEYTGFFRVRPLKWADSQ